MNVITIICILNGFVKTLKSTYTKFNIWQPSILQENFRIELYTMNPNFK
jgi:hypothetical protein